MDAAASPCAATSIMPRAFWPGAAVAVPTVKLCCEKAIVLKSRQVESRMKERFMARRRIGHRLLLSLVYLYRHASPRTQRDVGIQLHLCRIHGWLKAEALQDHRQDHHNFCHRKIQADTG